jgi:hypothetical protein
MNTNTPDTAVHDHLLQIHAVASEQAFLKTLKEVAIASGITQIRGESVELFYLREKELVVEATFAGMADKCMAHTSKMKELNERIRVKVRAED